MTRTTHQGIRITVFILSLTCAVFLLAQTSHFKKITSQFSAKPTAAKTLDAGSPATKSPAANSSPAASATFQDDENDPAKEAKYTRMKELRALVESLEAKQKDEPNNASLEDQIAAAGKEYNEISKSLGGDHPPQEESSFTAASAATPRNATTNSLAGRRASTEVFPANNICNTASSTFTDDPVPNVAIPNLNLLNPVIRNINVSGMGNYLWDVDIKTFITHTNSADLDVYLVSPAGTIVTLTTDNGGTNDNVFNGTLFDDQAATPVTDFGFANNVVATPVQPEEAMGAFIGENPNGTWQLFIYDDAASNTGQFDKLELTITTFAIAPVEVTSGAYANNTPQAIPNPGVISSTINVAGAGATISKVVLVTNVPHQKSDDLDITLTSPQGRTVTITTDNPDFLGLNYNNVFAGTRWFDRAGPGFLEIGAVTDEVYFFGVLKQVAVPEGAMAAFNGQNPNGTWTLQVRDDSTNSRSGSLQNWSLIISTINCTAPNTVVTLADPLVCLGPNGIVAVNATVTNNNPVAVNANFSAALPPTLIGLPGTGVASLNQPALIVTANGVTWNGPLQPGQTVTITYKAQIAAGTPNGSQVCIDSQTSFDGAPPATVRACETLDCPVGPVNAQVTDQKAGSVLVFPYYVSKVSEQKDTRMTISNIGDAAATVHLFFIDGLTCNQSDQFLCLTPNANFSFKASEYDPETTGWVLAVAVDAQGRPVQYNGLIGNAFVNDGNYVDNYGAESFRANSPLVATITDNAARLFFDGASYDAVPNQFAVEIQSPLDAPSQRVVTTSLSGNVITGQLTGAAQVGTALVYNGNEKPFGSFSAWLNGNCQASATITSTSPRVPNGMAQMIPTGQVGTLKFNVGAAVGLILTPRTAAWRGIRTLHKTALTTTTITIPILTPIC
ncbi:MAG: proprotein convertase P-domain-containing protein [Acidobacteria bacterium]|nr:proprotein convertase P-domain-containing protein [Acidobacteriota bacterium]